MATRLRSSRPLLTAIVSASLSSPRKAGAVGTDEDPIQELSSVTSRECLSKRPARRVLSTPLRQPPPDPEQIRFFVPDRKSPVNLNGRQTDLEGGDSHSAAQLIMARAMSSSV